MKYDNVILNYVGTMFISESFHPTIYNKRSKMYGDNFGTQKWPPM